MFRRPRYCFSFAGYLIGFLLWHVQSARANDAVWPLPGIAWNDEPTPAGSGEPRDQAQLSTSQERIAVGDVLELRAMLESNARPKTVYNPFFDPGLPAPGRLVVFDARRQYVADILPFQRELTKLPPACAWFNMNGAHRFGRMLRVRVLESHSKRSAPHGAADGELALALKPGQYSLQLVYTRRLLSGRPSELQDWMSPWHDAEHLRSNVVEVKIMARGPKDQRRDDSPAGFPAAREVERGGDEESAEQHSAETGHGECHPGINDLSSVADLSSHLSPAIYDYRLLEQKDLNCGKYRGRVAISVPRRRLVTGEDWLALQITFENTSEVGYRINDPTSPGPSILFRPAVLAVFDENRNCLGDLFETSWGHGGNPSPNAWKYLPAGAICGTGWSGKAGYIFPKHDHWEARLPPGRYYLQLVYLERFIAPPPGSDVEPPPPDAAPDALEEHERRLRKSMMQWPVKYGRPLFRSNVVEIQLLDKPDPPPIAQQSDAGTGFGRY